MLKEFSSASLQDLMAKLTESYCVERGIPVNRKFSDAELEDSKDLLAEASKQVEEIEQRLRAAL
jgi:hypothetical protein